MGKPFYYIFGLFSEILGKLSIDLDGLVLYSCLRLVISSTTNSLIVSNGGKTFCYDTCF